MRGSRFSGPREFLFNLPPKNFDAVPKAINEDELLAEVALRLGQQVRGGPSRCRFGTRQSLCMYCISSRSLRPRGNSRIRVSGGCDPHSADMQSPSIHLRSRRSPPYSSPRCMRCISTCKSRCNRRSRNRPRLSPYTSCILLWMHPAKATTLPYHCSNRRSLELYLSLVSVCTGVFHSCI